MAKPPKYSPLFESMFGKQDKDARIVSYDGVDPSLIYRLVVAVVDAGCAVLFGSTRDRGAWALTFMGDAIPGSRQTDYQNNPDELNDWILGWVEQWEGVAEQLKAPKGT